ncbi:MAG: hypothetical protein UV64_C0006G0020 [Parcubacteria group bacterium GW2011_GWC1_43_11b]|nr:MAG: hypothetical protein UV50_C0004G0032 [Parcubacteria group bacterium GW2011_GWB1_42_9]KKS89440.1 MAG: hypothetical protein UV64_C0006G0020 [Parcubacteria group bacterium GW2011_GWC1_43_11b]KKT10027.1 MAG: hypothetical protein UV88_C0003G0029 [Parcubacteria group bacterium GW2011_GWA1_43_21]
MEQIKIEGEGLQVVLNKIEEAGKKLEVREAKHSGLVVDRLKNVLRQMNLAKTA